MLKTFNFPAKLKKKQFIFMYFLICLPRPTESCKADKKKWSTTFFSNNCKMYQHYSAFHIQLGAALTLFVNICTEQSFQALSSFCML
jgi:hypothetical protein